MSSASFSEITICTNTPKYSLFDAPKTAKINRRVLKIIPDKLGCWYQEGDTGGIPYLCEFFFVFRDNYMHLYLYTQPFRCAKDRQNRLSRFEDIPMLSPRCISVVYFNTSRRGNPTFPCSGPFQHQKRGIPLPSLLFCSVPIFCINK